MWQFEILPGLPPYGPEALPFSATGQGTHGEGLVVRFRSSEGRTWTGNFQRGTTALNLVWRHPDAARFAVIAGGQTYWLDPNDPSAWQCSGGSIEHAIVIEAIEALLLSNGIAFELLGATGTIWRSRRVSWDGMCNLALNGLDLTGEAWSPIENRWCPFRLCVVEGSVEGGSFDLSR